MSASERRVPFYRAGEDLAGEPAGWVVYGPNAEVLRQEWNPGRQQSELERGLAADGRLRDEA